MKPVRLSLFGIAALLVCAFTYADDDKKPIEISVVAAPMFETLTKGGIKFFNPSNQTRPGSTRRARKFT